MDVAGFRASAVLDEREREYRFRYEVLAVTDEVGIARWMASADIPRNAAGCCTTASRGRVEGALHAGFREWWNTAEEPLG